MQKYNRKLFMVSGILIGIGLGGFIDGIIFHQIFQLHNMLSNKIFPDTVVSIEVNMFWDGLFHLFTWICTLSGITLLWKVIRKVDLRRMEKTFWGATLIGFGMFNFIEGLMNHLILELHHVIQRATPSMQYFSDLMFMASGAILVFIGNKLVDKNKEELLTKREKTKLRIA